MNTKKITKREKEINDLIVKLIRKKFIDEMVTSKIQNAISAINIEDQFRNKMKVSLEAIIRKYIRAEIEIIERSKNSLIELDDYCYLNDIPKNKVKEYLKKNRISSFKVGNAIFVTSKFNKS